MLAHPTTKQIELLAQGQLGESEATPMLSHLSDCSDCREKHEECISNQAWEKNLRDAIGVGNTRRWSSIDGDSEAGTTTIPNTDVIDGYTLGEKLGGGGQGVVYQAVQQFPHRKVAIKFLLAGTDADATAKKRFEREIAIAVMLKHPNIVTIHDSGLTSDGRRFCVMEYVRGEPLAKYVQEKKLTLVETLGLFVSVCDAVNYAHQRGIMHRDLKPSNILVDANGQVKVLDFGLARMVAELSDTAVSRTGQVVGAPAYLSPEQTRGSPDEIDIRTDVYSLGIILYELLTGGYPYLVDCDWPDLITHIRESVPTPPSSVWTAESGVQPDQKPQRIRRIRRSRCPINKEIETIILVCLRKERERRYQSAGELARDIHHYLAGERIDAMPDSLWYLLRKTLYRHRKAVAVGTMMALLIAVGLFSGARQRARLEEQKVESNRSAARAIIESSVSSFSKASEQIAAADASVMRHLISFSRTNVCSSAFTDRIAGARCGLVLVPEAFWKSVDGGALWRNGEWLELCRMELPDRDRARILKLLAEKATSGTNREKYVAFCLIGHLAHQADDLDGLCVDAMESESHPGVLSAAGWAAMRLGRSVVSPQTRQIITDELSGATFVRIPGCASFRRGSDLSEQDRYDNETKPEMAVQINALYVAVTEVTIAELDTFLNDLANADMLGPSAAADSRHMLQKLRHELKMLLDKDPKTAAGYVSLNMARRYCQWLTARAGGVIPPRRYRLPTEDEWEYACRSENEGRFCFGNDADYVSYFANCNGSQQSHVVGQRMPNWYGLFDMHGGLWEWCDSQFPSKLTGKPELAGKELYVKRGGSFYSPAVRCRSAQRNYGAAHPFDYYAGFRLAMEVAGP